MSVDRGVFEDRYTPGSPVALLPTRARGTSTAPHATVTEYGGGDMEYRVEGYMWCGDPDKDTKPNACGERNCQDCVTDKILAYHDALKPLIVDGGLSALAITQYTDLEIERNGLLTYDRKVRKCHFDRVRAKNIEMIAAGRKVHASPAAARNGVRRPETKPERASREEPGL